MRSTISDPGGNLGSVFVRALQRCHVPDFSTVTEPHGRGRQTVQQDAAGVRVISREESDQRVEPRCGSSDCQNRSSSQEFGVRPQLFDPSFSATTPVSSCSTPGAVLSASNEVLSDLFDTDIRSRSVCTHRHGFRYCSALRHCSRSWASRVSPASTRACTRAAHRAGPGVRRGMLHAPSSGARQPAPTTTRSSPMGHAAHDRRARQCTELCDYPHSTAVRHRHYCGGAIGNVVLQPWTANWHAIRLSTRLETLTCSLRHAWQRDYYSATGKTTTRCISRGRRAQLAALRLGH